MGSISLAINSIIFAALGIILFVLGFWLIDRFTPYQLWKEICEKNNMALATFLGACALGICIIIASAIH